MAEERRPVLCADLGGTTIQAAVVQSDGRLVSRAFALTAAQEGPDRVIDRLAGTLREALSKAGMKAGDVVGLGVGAPGPLDPESGILFSPPNLPGWDHICLSEALSERFSLRCFVDNDVNVATLGEHAFGAARGADCAVGIFIGTGVGGGIIVGGRLHYGLNRSAGEVGHMVVASGAAICNCGVNGCLEALASRTAMVKRLRSAVEEGSASDALKTALQCEPDLSSGRISALYEARDPTTRKVVDDAGYYIGVAMGSLINLLSPEVIVLGGGVIEAMWGLMSDKIQTSVAANVLSFAMRGVRIVKAELGDDAGVIGASIMARRRL